MELIDNKAKLLGDDLKKEIKSVAKIKMVASYFSIRQEYQSSTTKI